MPKQPKIPLIILMSGGLLALFGVYVAITSYTDPAGVVPGFTPDTPASEPGFYFPSQVRQR